MSAEVIDTDIIEISDGRLRLLGGRCESCGEIAFPRQDSCGSCGADGVSGIRLADRGVLWSWTIQRFPPPSPPYVPTEDDFTPFGLGYVELPGEVIVETRLTCSDPDQLRIGMPMRLTGIEVPTETGGVATTFAFAPADEGDTDE
ncbi:DNA-binding protein [Mycolicibacter heraklionensis]|nr:DNA-binding protein [Mycolicibacter heraklionensis]